MQRFSWFAYHLACLVVEMNQQYQQCTYIDLNSHFYTKLYCCMHVLVKPSLIIVLLLDHIVRTHSIISRTNVSMFYMQ
jgi:hypothetical protein